MRVICINAAKIDPCYCGYAGTKLKEGFTYSASEDPLYDQSYDIAEDSHCPQCGTEHSYRKNRFIPLSQIDETEMVREVSEIIDLPSR